MRSTATVEVRQSGSMLPRELAAKRYRQVRRLSEQICKPLAMEDYVVQTMDDVSPPKWNLAHTTWFFETFLLKAFLPGYREYHPRFNYLFNSYYEAVGERHPRPRRGLLSRPTVEDVYRYREHVDRSMLELLGQADEQSWERLEPLVTLGLHHEQQHQELMITDLKHILAANPLRPVYRERTVTTQAVGELGWFDYAGGVVEIGFDGAAFSFDNERPRHKIYLEDFRLASRLVTNGEFLEFLEAGGYRQPKHWLSEGWATVLAQGWDRPALLGKGRRALVEHDAFGVPAGRGERAASATSATSRRMLTRAGAASGCPPRASGRPRPPGCRSKEIFSTRARSIRWRRRRAADSPRQIYGDVWEWTQSQYTAYPGFQPEEGAIGEYNGKFMCNQFVLRGGSCATPADHIRPTYRNFFPPNARWQFTGIRLAESL